MFRTCRQRFERVGGAFRVERRAPLGLHRIALGRGCVLFAQVRFQHAAQLLQVGKQPPGVHHG
jgi:hypothetical protein